MRVYGNLMNRFAEHTKSPTPEVGMGATLYAYSDRYPATVTAVSASGKTITLTEDTVTEWKNDYGVTFARNPNGRLFMARLTKTGTWKALGSGEGVTLGARAAYRDPSF